METSIPLNTVQWLIGFLVTLLCGCWAIFKYFEAKLGRVYQRLDENKAQYYKDFLSREVYEAETKLRKENTDGHFERIVELFNEKIEGLRTEIRSLFKHKEL